MAKDCTIQALLVSALVEGRSSGIRGRKEINSDAFSAINPHHWENVVFTVVFNEMSVHRWLHKR